VHKNKYTFSIGLGQRFIWAWPFLALKNACTDTDTAHSTLTKLKNACTDETETEETKTGETEHLEFLPEFLFHFFQFKAT
jgi:hypothetical protein